MEGASTVANSGRDGKSRGEASYRALMIFLVGQAE